MSLSSSPVTLSIQRPLAGADELWFLKDFKGRIVSEILIISLGIWMKDECRQTHSLEGEAVPTPPQR
jgi:hypothetical protein